MRKLVYTAAAILVLLGIAVGPLHLHAQSTADGSKTHLVVRFTDVLRKSAGKWLIVQEHVSFPVDPTTGKADMLSTP